MFDATLGAAMASSIRGEPLEMKLKLLFGLSVESLLVVGLSVGALALGYGLYRWLRPGPTFYAPLRALGRFGPDRGFTPAGFAGLLALAAWHTRVVQSGYLRRYLLVVVGVFAAAVGPLAVRAFAAGRPLPPMGPIKAHELILALLVVAGAIYGVVLQVAAGLGRRDRRIGHRAGGSVCGVRLGPTWRSPSSWSRPLLVVILVLVLMRLPRLKRTSPRATRGRDLLIAAAGGTTVTLLVLASATVSLPATVSAYYLNRAVPEAYGRNVVNVILVDFRALDTLGEIIVVAVAGVGVASLVWLSRGRREGATPGGHP